MSDSKLDKLTKNLLINNLQKEYAIIQNKIDKIADFEFKVKGWCVTLSTAILISIFTDKIKPQYIYYILSFTFFLTLLFHYIEQQQVQNKKILSRRAVTVETALNRLIYINETFSERYNDKEKRNKEVERRDLNALKAVISTPRLGKLMRSGNPKLKPLDMSIFSPNKNSVLYYFQYIVIICLIIFFASTSLPCELP